MTSASTATSMDSVDVSCAECDGTLLGRGCNGWYTTLIEGRLESGRCRYRLLREQQEKIDALLGAIPCGLRRCTLETYIARDNSQRDALEVVRGWIATGLAERSGGLYLSGERGVGKTHLLVACLQVAAAQGLSVAMSSMSELLARYRSTYDRASNSNAGDIDAAVYGADVLGLDDLQAAKYTSWGLDLLQRLVDRRIADGRLLVVTCQTPLSALGEARRWGVQEDGAEHRHVLDLQDRLRQLCPWKAAIAGGSQRQGLADRVLAAIGLQRIPATQRASKPLDPPLGYVGPPVPENAQPAASSEQRDVS